MKAVILLALALISWNDMAQYATKIVVDQSGNGDFTSIQQAIRSTKAFPEKDITIYIKNGLYREKVTVYAWNNRLTIEGESRDSTTIVWDDHFAKIGLGRNSTFHTPTLQVLANDVTLKNLSIGNDSGPVGQAIALALQGDRIQVLNCQIDGNQDTLYVTGEGARQYFQNCLISGTTDFIFGQATVIFQNCILVSKSNSYITAASTPLSEPYGLVFIDCQLTRLNNEVQQVYLGRPWRSHAKTVFIRCEMDDHILPVGWHNWGSEAKEKSTYFAEYSNTGPGANEDQRATWSHILTEREASKFTTENIFHDWKCKNCR